MNANDKTAFGQLITDALAFYRRCGFEQVGTRTFRVGATDYRDAILGLEL